MVAASNVYWQFQQTIGIQEKGGAWYVNLWGSVNKYTVCFVSLQKLNNQQRSKLHDQHNIKNDSNLLSIDKMTLMAN